MTHMISSSRYADFIAGVLGGVVPTFLLHPLDLVKIRLQVFEGTGTVKRPAYNGFFDAFRQIVRTDGFMGLYQGSLPNVLGAGASWGFYFLFYSQIKVLMQHGDLTKPLSPGHHLFAGAQAGFLTLLLTNPIWVLKTRMCLQYGTKYSDKPKQTLRQAFRSLWQESGFFGLYKGFLPGVFAISHGAIQFMIYEEFKNQYHLFLGQPITTKLSPIEYMLFGGFSKIIASCATHPIQTVKSRMQEQHRQYKGLVDVITQIVRYEGYRGFYKGLLPALLRVTPANMITMVVYENTAHFLKKL